MLGIQFKLGDVVMLKSGGPNMTVGELTNDGYLRCMWFRSWDKPPMEWHFEPEMLVLRDEEDPDGFYDEDDEDSDEDFQQELNSKFRRGDLTDAEVDALIADKFGYDRGH